ncbi:hypothetical protein ONR57_03605 [Hoyosella sp. YIM 151337]|nr:hypothetical protein [Hoyosella sp. YIM 151337]MCW4352383.1 hypothetical protein [Hoyosella sp. YIM 151337]
MNVALAGVENQVIDATRVVTVFSGFRSRRAEVVPFPRRPAIVVPIALPT